MDWLAVKLNEGEEMFHCHFPGKQRNSTHKEHLTEKTGQTLQTLLLDHKLLERVRVEFQKIPENVNHLPRIVKNLRHRLRTQKILKMSGEERGKNHRLPPNLRPYTE